MYIPGILFVIVHPEANHVGIVHYVVVGKGGSLGGKRNEKDEDAGLPLNFFFIVPCALDRISFPKKEVTKDLVMFFLFFLINWSKFVVFIPVAEYFIICFLCFFVIFFSFQPDGNSDS